MKHRKEMRFGDGNKWKDGGSEKAINSGSLQGKLAPLLPLDMQLHQNHLGCNPRKLACTVTVHHAQSLHIMSETQVKPECLAPQLAAVEQVFLVVDELCFRGIETCVICFVEHSMKKKNIYK